jgi:hypothetical protein
MERTLFLRHRRKLAPPAAAVHTPLCLTSPRVECPWYCVFFVGITKADAGIATRRGAAIAQNATVQERIADLVHLQNFVKAVKERDAVKLARATAGNRIDFFPGWIVFFLGNKTFHGRYSHVVTITPISYS